MNKVVNKKYSGGTIDVRSMIEKAVRRKGEVTAADIRRVTGFSRAYINRFFRELQSEGRLVLVGKANRARYIPAIKRKLLQVRRLLKRHQRFLKNKNLSEDRVLDEIKETTGIFFGLPERVTRIVDYGFTEMLNNAIEHSRSKTITVTMERLPKSVRFVIADRGVGIFKNIMRKKKLESELVAIQDLLKGKQTTDPERHSGEGIFFTSKVADHLMIKAAKKRLAFDNQLHDVFLKDGPPLAGTTVVFSISTTSDRKIETIFRAHTDESYKFGKTSLAIHLFQGGAGYVSRSQARRMLVGLEKFRTITLNFKGVAVIGQAFADEVFRVWKKRNLHIIIEVENANKNVELMIRHARQLEPSL